MEFKSLDELVAYTKNKIAASMPEVGKEMKEIVKGEVNKQVYSNYAPSLYDRTYELLNACLLYTSPSPRDRTRSRMPSSA
ncbi:hypothetical protein CDFC105_104053 [Clostridioides difficile]|nr:hypothetical protein CDFC105_104053 [Clostridioides difficile]